MERSKRKARRPAGEPVTCEACGKQTTEPRTGLCPGCYHRRRRGSPSFLGECALCGIGDQRMLKAVKMSGQQLCLCRNHAWIAERSSPRPRTLDELRELVSPRGNRRRATERRSADRRKAQRRTDQGDRRTGPRPADKGDRRLSDRRQVA